MDLSRTFLDWTKCQKERDKILRSLLIGTYQSSQVGTIIQVLFLSWIPFMQRKNYELFWQTLFQRDSEASYLL